MKTALSIAGSDPCGGAGIQADIKTMTLNGVYAMSVITAVTAQNTTGVYGVFEVSPDFLAKQIEVVFDDIRPDSVKIGMVSSEDLIKVIADKLSEYNAVNVVLDPVMIATNGGSLINSSATEALASKLFSLADVLTPNIPEAEIISKLSIKNAGDMENAAKKIGDAFSCAVLIKGGHSINTADDVLYKNGNIKWFRGEMIDNPNTHGTGCTLSSAIAANLAKGYDLESAVDSAKKYVTGAISAMLDLGSGRGPMNHAYKITY